MSGFLKAFFLVTFVSSTVFSAEYGVGSTDKTDTVYFNSTAKLEFIQGQTNNVEGGFSFDSGNPNSTVSGIIRVDLRTLKTGIETRDGHMRDNHLHTKKYPFAYFELESLEPTPTLAILDSIYSVNANGKFYIHGCYREIEAKLEIVRKKTPSGDETISVWAKCSINLDDYKIPRPKALFLKLAETVEVEVIFTGHQSISPISILLPDWQKLD